jgi:hypothetical protein
VSGNGKPIIEAVGRVEVPDDKVKEDKVPAAPDADWFLQALVRFANEKFLNYAVTLHVGGLTVTGTIVSGREYFEHWSKAATDTITWRNNPHGCESADDARAAIRDMFMSFGDKVYPERDGDEETAVDIFKDGPQYVHLKDARFFLGGAFVPNNQPVLWRGRITEVDGWFLGTLSAD